MPHCIKNFDALAATPERTDALSIAEAGYAAIDVAGAIKRKARLEGDELIAGGRRYPLAGRRVRFIGIGKCAVAAARGVEALFGERLSGGIAFDVSAVEKKGLAKIEALIGTHPEPSDANMRATARIMSFLAESRPDDFLLMLISGGGSTLLCLHDAPMTCLDERILFDGLTARGASIQDLNTVRKHISKARGGGLAAAAYPAEILALIVSDVPGNDIAYVASGPTVRDDSSVADAKAVLERFTIRAPEGTLFIETPKEAKYFERVTNALFLTNRDALEAMRGEAKRLGYRAEIADERFSGEAAEAGRKIAARLNAAPSKTALLFGGETTVTLGAGAKKGGRNMEVALAAAVELREGGAVVPFASDGRDNTEYAGAIGDAMTGRHAKEKGIIPETVLAEHSTYDFFTATGDFLLTGYTGSNVSDLVVALKK